MLRLQRTTRSERIDFPANADVLTIGRTETNHVVLDNPHVSALHGQITRRQGRYIYQDLHSTNGSAIVRHDVRTVVDGLAVTELALQVGDRILIGHEKEPVELVVIACQQAEDAIVKGATIVATHPMASAGEASGRIESKGGTLVPYLALAERLALVTTSEEACSVFLTCIRKLTPGVTNVQVLEPTDPPKPTGTEAIAVVQNDDTRMQTVHLPVDAGPGPRLSARVDSSTDRLHAGDLDGLVLATSLLAARLRQLRLVTQLESARAGLAVKNRYLREKAEARASTTMVGAGRAMQALKEQIGKVALSNATVLITGPSGSGKELVARELHRQSLRHAELFAAVNCGALVENLLETELFGCRKGAFTGAIRDRAGMFEVAHGGSLFLDEIGDMSPALQVKLLRVLECGEVTPVGETRPRQVDVRVIAATNRDLQALVSRGDFREDLFYRIHVVPISVPSLADRTDDIPLLVRHFIRKFAEASGSAVQEVSDEALRVLSTRDYPGNIRQLANEVLRAVVLAGDAVCIEPGHLSPTEDGAASRAVRAAGSGSLKEQMGSVEKNLIQEALAKCQGNRTHTARRLGITRQALLVKLNKYRIDRPD